MKSKSAKNSVRDKFWYFSVYLHALWLKYCNWAFLTGPQQYVYKLKIGNLPPLCQKYRFIFKLNQQLIDYIANILTSLREVGILNNIKKYKFLNLELEYIKHTIQPRKIWYWPRTYCISERTSLSPHKQIGATLHLGLCNVYHQFISNFAHKKMVSARITSKAQKVRPGKYPSQRKAAEGLLRFKWCHTFPVSSGLSQFEQKYFDNIDTSAHETALLTTQYWRGPMSYQISVPISIPHEKKLPTFKMEMLWACLGFWETPHVPPFLEIHCPCQSRSSAMASCHPRAFHYFMRSTHLHAGYCFYDMYEKRWSSVYGDAVIQFCTLAETTAVDSDEISFFSAKEKQWDPIHILPLVQRFKYARRNHLKQCANLVGGDKTTPGNLASDEKFSTLPALISADPCLSSSKTKRWPLQNSKLSYVWISVFILEREWYFSF